jgi:predicted ferric reductase
VTLQRLPGDVVRVSFPRGSLRYTAGQYMFLCVPKLSLWEWHPFSISSNEADESVTMHVRVLGDWTRALHKLGESQVGAQQQPWLCRMARVEPARALSGRHCAA